MGVGIVSVATIWIGSIAVGLNLACRWAAKASRTRVKLDDGEWLDPNITIQGKSKILLTPAALHVPTS